MKRDKTSNMNEHSNQDWELFNLLEGELGELEAKNLLLEIEQDERLRNEWELLQQTQLPVESIIYKHKSSLLKTDEKRIIVLAWWQKPLKIAASIALLTLLAVPLYQFVSQETSRIDGVLSNIRRGEVEQNLAGSKSGSKLEEPILLTDDKKVSTIKNPVVVQHKVKSQHPVSTKMQSIINVIDTLTQKNHSVKNQPEIQGIAQVAIKTNGMTFVSNEISHQPFGVDAQLSNNFTNIDLEKSEYTGLRNAMNNGLATLVEPIRNSSIRIRKLGVKGDPGFKLEWKSDQYYAIAMVHLLPKNNR